MIRNAFLLLAAVASVPFGSAHATGYSVIHSFSDGGDANAPYAGLVADSAGNLYGTTFAGGANGRGAVFQVASNGTETVLYSFTGGNDGANPDGGLIFDKDGNLYGTTSDGGADDAGGVFKLAPNGTETVLYSFTGGNDGGHSSAGVIMDKTGNLYGTTDVGGVDNAGVVFKVAPNGTETVLYSFTGGNDGGYPYGGLIRDKAHNLYGTTAFGGAGGRGVVFKIAPNGTETVLYSFTGSDGSVPNAGLIKDADGNLYSTTTGGGANNHGVVFKLAPNGTETVLYSFAGGSDGSNPDASLIMDKTGNLYSTTVNGGAFSKGTVFKLAPNGTETVLYSFTGLGDDGWGPISPLILRSGKLYGTTFGGGTDGHGVVFKLKK